MKKNHIKALAVVALALLLQSCSSVSDITKKDVAIVVIGVGAVASLMGACEWVDGDEYDDNNQPVDPTINPYQSVFTSDYGNGCVDFFLGGSE